jgi:hypothetical protein
VQAINEYGYWDSGIQKPLQEKERTPALLRAREFVCRWEVTGAFSKDRKLGVLKVFGIV